MNDKNDLIFLQKPINCDYIGYVLGWQPYCT